MVTEILRPTDVYLPGGGKDYTTKVNESVADDDASYIEPSGHIIVFDSEHLRNNYANIKNVAMFCRVKLDPSLHSLSVQHMNMNGDTISEVSFVPTTVNNWETISANFNAQDIIRTIQESLDNNSSQLLRFCSKKTNLDPNNKNSGTVCLTQVYIEVTYEDNSSSTTDTIYLKENGSWTTIPCTIYQKQNGVWVLTDSTIFANGDKYTLQKTSGS